MMWAYSYKLMDNALEKIYKAGLKFLVPLTPEETYRLIVQEAVKLVKGAGGAILLEEEGELRRVYRLAPASPPAVRVRKTGFAYQSYRYRRVILADTKELNKAHPEIVKRGIKSSIFIPIYYGNKSMGVLTIRSTNGGHFKETEAAILKLFGSMASLAIRKTQLYDEAKKAIEIRDLFLSMAAHEFRTPLTTISGYVQLLSNKFPKDINPQSRWIEELVWETGRLTSLVNELLEISRIKGGQFQYVWRECHLKQVIERAISDVHFSYPKRTITFIDKLKIRQDVVIGDFGKLLQVVINILDNAAKFSSGVTVISVTLKSRGSDLVIIIKDSGQGIQNKELPKIFEGFYRGNNAIQGMGLGLFLAKNVMVQHHGYIDIRSKVGKGTTVELTLPRAKIGKEDE